jgi:ligand-binding sensor domain-containing protein/signal transduction histidine kinase
MKQVLKLVALLLSVSGVFTANFELEAAPATTNIPGSALDLNSLLMRTWKNQDGLPIEWVECLWQSRDGFLWLGTPEGLVRFDGTRFVQITSGDGTSVTPGACKGLAEDADGYLWIATKKGVTCLAQGQTMTFRQKDGLLNDETSSLSPERNGGMWFGTGAGVSLWQHGIWRNYPSPNSNYRFVYSLLEDSQGLVWVGLFEGLYQLNPGTGEFKPIWKPDLPNYVIESSIVRCLYQDRQGRLWFGTDHSVMWYDQGAIHTVSIGATSPQNRVKQILQDTQGRIWAVIGNTVRIFDGTQFVSMDTALGLADLAANCIFEDRDGRLWIGSRYGGLRRMKPTPLRVLTRKDGLVHNNIRSIIQSRNGHLWVASDGGVNRIEGSQVSTLPIDPAVLIRSCRWMLESQNGDLWLGMAPTEIVRMIRRPSGFQTYRSLSLPSESVTACVDSASNLWAGTKSGYLRHVDRTFPDLEQGPGANEASLYGENWFYFGREPDQTQWIRITTKTTGSVVFTNGDFLFTIDQSTRSNPKPEVVQPAADCWKNERLLNFPASDNIRVIIKDRQGALWFGTSEGLSQLQNRSFTSFSTNHGLPDKSIRCLYEDQSGRLWIGTDSGLARSYKTGFRSVTEKQGLPRGPVHQILEDRLGYFWMGSDLGIYRVSHKDLEAAIEQPTRRIRCHLLNDADGMLTSQTSIIAQPAACRSSDGQLWFPTPQGLVVIDPTRVKDDAQLPPVRIEVIRAMNQVLYDDAAFDRVDKSRMPWSKGVSNRLSESLPHFQRNLLLPAGSGHYLEIHYGAIDLAAPEKLQFQYLLEGYDHNWINASNRRVAYYTNLKPGPYQFRVRAANKHGQWNEAQDGLTFTLIPYFHQTWIFYVLCGLGILGMFVGTHWYLLLAKSRLLQLRHQFAVEHERARIAQDLHDDLGSSLTEICIMSEIARSRAPDVPPPLEQIDRIAETARQAVDRFSELIWATNPVNDTLDNLCSYLRENTARFLESSNVQAQLRFPREVPVWRLSARFRRHLLLVVKEAINNAVRHAAPTLVRVTVTIQSVTLTIAIEDNGKGMVVDDQSKSQRGLSNMHKRIAELQGNLTIESTPGSGTRVVIQVALPKQEEGPPA